jgi:hypothetical protein
VRVRDAIDIFQTSVESAIGNLLDHDQSKTLIQIENAHNRAMKDVKALGSDIVPMEQEAKVLHLADGLLEKMFSRLRERMALDAMSGTEPEYMSVLAG